MTAYSTSQRDYYRRKHDRIKLDPELYIATLDGVRTPEQDLIERQEWQRFEQLIDCLTPPRLGLAFRYRCGIGCKPMTYSQIAEKFGCTTTRVQQIVHKAERILRYKILRQKDPKLLRDILAREEAQERAKKDRLNEENRRWAEEVERRHTREELEREAQRAAESARYRAEYFEKCERLAFDEAYHEAHQLNNRWREEAERRERVIRQQRNAVERAKAFEFQARDLKAAYEAYYASIGTPAEHYCYVIYNNRMRYWGPIQDRIWRDFPYG